MTNYYYYFFFTEQPFIVLLNLRAVYHVNAGQMITSLGKLLARCQRSLEKNVGGSNLIQADSGIAVIAILAKNSHGQGEATLV